MRDLFLLVITCAHVTCKAVGYTGRFVVGRGRRWSLGCGLHTYEFSYFYIFLFRHHEPPGLPVLFYQTRDEGLLRLGDEVLEEQCGAAVAACARGADGLLHRGEAAVEDARAGGSSLDLVRRAPVSASVCVRGRACVSVRGAAPGRVATAAARPARRTRHCRRAAGCARGPAPRCASGSRSAGWR